MHHEAAERAQGVAVQYQALITIHRAGAIARALGFQVAEQRIVARLLAQEPQPPVTGHQRVLAAKRLQCRHHMPDLGGKNGLEIDGFEVFRRLREVAAHGYFFRQGDEALYMYVLESGRASVRKVWGEHDIAIAQ